MKFGLVISLWLLASCSTAQAQQLAGVAVLPSSTFVDAPTSGQFIGPANGVVPPFEFRRPVQGFSALLRDGQSAYLAMSDNGFGLKSNSQDYVLNIARLLSDFHAEEDSGERLRVDTVMVLCDPNNHIDFPIVASGEFYPGEGIKIPVDPTIVNNRLLTGSDFDIESFRRAPDGTFWFGDEYGPFLIHTDSVGRVLEPPHSLPAHQSPENPLLSPHPPIVRSSGGFEGMAMSLDGHWLYPVLEKPIVGDPGRQIRIYKFDVSHRRYADVRPFRFYRLSSPEHLVAEFTALSETKVLALERDNHQGEEAEFKKIFLVDFAVLDEEQYLVKRELVDLLAIPDPANLGGQGEHFRYPFKSIEGVEIVDDRTIAVINDNNYPMSVGRHLNDGLPDDTELILIRFENPIALMDVMASDRP